MSRRRTGSIYRDRGKVVLAVTVDGGRRVRHATYPDTPEGWAAAERERTILAGLRASGDYLAPTGATLGEWLSEWVAGLGYEVAAGRLQPNTAATYETDLTSKVIPRLGRVALEDLTAAMIRRLYSELLAGGGRNGKPLAAKSVRNVAVTLRKALDAAVAEGRLKANPAAAVKPPKASRTPIETWNPDQVATFMATLSAPVSTMVRLLATTGVRRSELLGLRWASVDLEALELTVCAKLIVVKSRPVFSELTKTDASRRTIALDPGSVDELRRHRVRQTEQRLENADVWHDGHGLVFTDEIGRPFHPNRLTRTLIAAASDAGLPPIGVHGLRHSLATAALEMGVPAKVVAERLGHASVATTLDRYSHVSREQDRDAAVALAERMLD